MGKRLLVLILIAIVPCIVHSQSFGLKSNLAYWATTTPNLGVEVSLSEKYTLNIAGGYNAWSFWAKGRSLRHVLVQPGLRYWPCRAFEGHFFGLHGHLGDYNVARLPFFGGMGDYNYRGQLYGGGVSYGYHFAIGGRWGVELSLGVGYAYMEYNKYVCAECAELIGRYKRHYFGPTSLGASIIYFIN